MNIMGLSFTGSSTKLTGEAKEISLEVVRQAKYGKLMVDFKNLYVNSPVGSSFQQNVLEKTQKYRNLTGLTDAADIGLAAGVKSGVEEYVEKLLKNYSGTEYNYMSNRDKLQKVSDRALVFLDEQAADIELAYPDAGPAIVAAAIAGTVPVRH